MTEENTPRLDRLEKVVKVLLDCAMRCGVYRDAETGEAENDADKKMLRDALAMMNEEEVEENVIYEVTCRECGYHCAESTERICVKCGNCFPDATRKTREGA